MSRWRIEYDNDTGPNDDGFWELWTVVDSHDGGMAFKCATEEAAKWLASVLNSHDVTQLSL